MVDCYQKQINIIPDCATQRHILGGHVTRKIPIVLGVFMINHIRTRHLSYRLINEPLNHILSKLVAV